MQEHGTYELQSIAALFRRSSGQAFGESNAQGIFITVQSPAHATQRFEDTLSSICNDKQNSIVYVMGIKEYSGNISPLTDIMIEGVAAYFRENSIKKPYSILGDIVAQQTYRQTVDSCTQDISCLAPLLSSGR